MDEKKRHTSALEILISGILSTVVARLIGRYVLGEEWIRRAERIDNRADELAEERKRERQKAETLPGFDEMLESRHRSLQSLSVPPTVGWS